MAPRDLSQARSTAEEAKCKAQATEVMLISAKDFRENLHSIISVFLDLMREGEQAKQSVLAEQLDDYKKSGGEFH